MTIYQGSTELSNIAEGSSSLSAVYVGDTQIRPTGRQPGSNTIIYLPLESDYSDLSSYNRTYTSTSGTLSFSSYSGVNAAYFNMGYVEFSLTDLYLNSCTYSVWVSCVRTSTWEIIGFCSDNTYTYFIDPYIMRGGHRGVYRGSGRDTAYDCDTGVTYSTGWHLYTCTVSGTTITVYLDGVSIGTFSKTSSATALNYLNVGARYDIYSYQGWKGRQSNLIIENVVRTSDEVLAYYNLTKGNYGL